MKKRILIVNHYMEIGGAERSLLGLLNTIDTKNMMWICLSIVIGESL